MEGEQQSDQPIWRPAQASTGLASNLGKACDLGFNKNQDKCTDCN